MKLWIWHRKWSYIEYEKPKTKLVFVSVTDSSFPNALVVSKRNSRPEYQNIWPSELECGFDFYYKPTFINDNVNHGYKNEKINSKYKCFRLATDSFADKSDSVRT